MDPNIKALEFYNDFFRITKNSEQSKKCAVSAALLILGTLSYFAGDDNARRFYLNVITEINKIAI